MPEDCIFCKIVAGEVPAYVVDQDDQTLTFMDIAPATRGHALAIPKRHATDLWEIEPDQLAAVAVAAQPPGAPRAGSPWRCRRKPDQQSVAARRGRRSSTSIFT